ARRDAPPARAGRLPARARRGGPRRARRRGRGAAGRRDAPVAGGHRPGGGRADGVPCGPPRVLGETVIGALVPMVQLPPRGLWRTNGGAQHLPLAAWTGRAVQPATDAVGEELVRRSLAAFGPAATADLRAWSGLAGLPRAVA